MTIADGRMKILVNGLHDWISLSEALSLVRRSSSPGSGPDDLRSETLDAVQDLLERGLVRAGDVTDHFEPWAGTPGEVIRHLRGEWTEPNTTGWLGICWFANTPAGDALARPVWDALPDPSEE